MKNLRDYSKSPAKAFDAVNDVMDYFGERYALVVGDMGKILDVQAFGMYCDFAGITGYPVEAWYDHFHGEGAYGKAWDALEPAPDLQTQRTSP